MDNIDKSIIAILLQSEEEMHIPNNITMGIANNFKGKEIFDKGEYADLAKANLKLLKYNQELINDYMKLAMDTNAINHDHVFNACQKSLDETSQAIQSMSKDLH